MDQLFPIEFLYALKYWFSPKFRKQKNLEWNQTNTPALERKLFIFWPLLAFIILGICLAAIYFHNK